jgi:hypothetical protein
MGALIEVGSALGAGKRVYLVSPHDWSWKHHPRVRVFDTLEAAVTAIMAAANTKPRAAPSVAHSAFFCGSNEKEGRTVCYHFATQLGSTG